MNHLPENPTSANKKHPTIQGTRRIVSGAKSKVYSLQVREPEGENGGDLRECIFRDLLSKQDTTISDDEMRRIRG